MLSPDHDAQLQRLSRRLGLRNGLVIGLALALGTWAPDAIALSSAHAQFVYPPRLLGLLTLLLLGGLAGWLAAWPANAFLGGLIWAIAAALTTWTIGHLPYEGRNLTVWLADRRFWGLPVYPFSPAAQARLLMAGFFIVLLLTVLGLLQGYRLEGIASETDADGRMTARAWFQLLLPLPLAFAVGLGADNLVNAPERAAQQLVHRAIRTGRTYPGDLFDLGQADGINYSAISGVRDSMTGHYSLTVGQITLGVANAFVVVAYFDNAAWINCRVTADQLFHCYDASPPYRQGFPALLAAGETPPDCRACTVKVSEAQRAWLLAQAENVAGQPHVTRLAQWGSHVLMRAEWPASGYAAECLFHDLSPVTLERCQPLSLRGRAAPEAISTQHLGDRFASYGGWP